MSNTEAFGWTCIFMGMVVGVMTWFIVLASIFYDMKNKDKE